MKAEIKYLNSPDIYDLELYIPKEKDNFGFLLELEIGILNKEGGDLFNVMVCTPKWFSENYKSVKIIFGLHFIFMFEYEYTILYNMILNYINNIEEETWDGIALKLSYLGKWEFEDYKPFKE
jgi:hypothetical protein